MNNPPRLAAVAALALAAPAASAQLALDLPTSSYDIFCDGCYPPSAGNFTTPAGVFAYFTVIDGDGAGCYGQAIAEIQLTDTTAHFSCLALARGYLTEARAQATFTVNVLEPCRITGSIGFQQDGYSGIGCELTANGNLVASGPSQFDFEMQPGQLVFSGRASSALFEQTTNKANITLLATPLTCPADVTTTSTNPGDPGYGVPDGVVNGADLSRYVELWLGACP